RKRASFTQLIGKALQECLPGRYRMLVRQHLQAVRQCQARLQKRGELAKYLVAVMWSPAIPLRAAGDCQRMQRFAHQPVESRIAVSCPQSPASGLSFNG